MERAGESASATMGDLMVVALAGEAAVALCALDRATGALSILDKQPLPGAEGACRGVPMVASADASRIYVAWRGEAFRLYSFALDRDALQLTCLGHASLPASMCYVAMSADGRRVLTSSNTGSTIAISPIDSAGCADDPIQTLEAHKAHCIVEAPNGLLYATSLRGDFVQSYVFEAESGSLSPDSRLDLPEGSGPRHILFTADGTRAYLLSEFAGTLTCLDVDAQSGALSVRDRVDLLPGADKAWAAELRLGPGQDMLYASERSTSQIFTYRLGAQGEMHLLGAVPAPDCPTAFDLDASGTNLIALGEKSAEAWTYRITPDGIPELASRTDIGAVPSWVLSL